MPGQICPFHASDWPASEGHPDGSTSYTCERTDHPQAGPHSWLEAAPPPAGSGLEGLAAELGLDVELPAAVTGLGGEWVEYGLVERAYAERRPDDFARLVQQYGHRAVSPSQYTVSAFLAGCLGRLSRTGSIAYHDGPATGDWSYNGRISWWAPANAPVWSEAGSWQAKGANFSYVPGAVAR